MLCFVFLLSYDRNGPLLVVASGRDTISVASSIRRLAMEYVFVVQVKSFPRKNQISMAIFLYGWF